MYTKKLKIPKFSQGGFVPLLITLAMAIVAVIVLVFLRVVHAHN